MKKFLSGAFWVVVTLVLLYGAACFFPYFNISETEVTGIDSLTKEQVLEICGVENGTNIFIFNTSKACKKLKENNYVKEAKIVKSLPHKLTINIVENQVRGYIPYMNAYLYIDENGRVLDSKTEMKKQLPILTGLKFDGFVLGEVLETDSITTYKSVSELAELFSRYELLDAVIKVDVADDSDIHMYIDKLEVKFGGFDDANEKIAYLNEILKTVDTSVAGTVDLTLDNPIYKYRD